LRVLVLFVVFLSVGGEDLPLLSSLLSFIVSLGLELLQELGVSSLLLLHVLGHNSTIAVSTSIRMRSISYLGIFIV